MIDTSWQDYFPDHILDRGKDYAISGHVGDLKVDESRISAIVHGSSPYKVSIDLNNGSPTKMSCNCPYADGGNRCKHMAAVLYEAGEYFGKPEDMRKTNVTDPLENADRKELITFIDDILVMRIGKSCSCEL